MAANRDPIAFDRPDEFLPERWLHGRKGRTDLPGPGGEKLGVTHLTYGCGRRVCPGIDSTFELSLFLSSRGSLGRPRRKANPVLQWPIVGCTLPLFCCCISSPGSVSHWGRKRRSTSSHRSALSASAPSRWMQSRTQRPQPRLKPFPGLRVSSSTVATPKD